MEDFYDLSLEIDDVKRVTKFLHKNAAKLEENEEILEVFRLIIMNLLIFKY